MRNTRFSIVLAATLMLACNDSPINGEKYVDELPGLASPIQLNPESTLVYLEDYFPDASGVTWLSADSGLKVSADTTERTLYITGRASSPVSAVKVSYQGQEYSIPVFASEKQEVVFRYKPSRFDVKDVAMAGTINGWNPSASPLEKEGEDYVLKMWLAPGHYSYQMVEDGVWMVDANNPMQKDNGMGAMNSVLVVGKPDAVRSSCRAEWKDNSLIILPEAGIEGILVFAEDQEIRTERENGQILVDLPDWLKALERSHVRVWSWDANGRCNDLLIPCSKGLPVTNVADLDRHDMQSNVMYFAMVDRFKNGDPSNDKPTDDPEILPKANHYGGDLAGISQVAESGYFDSLGVNALWISPITQNPEGAYGLWDKGIRSKFSAYHGYWPISSTQVDYRFGSSESLKEMISELHEHDINLFLDYVANHVHEEHPVYRQHPDWATELYLPDGTLNTERWDEYRLTTWFDVFLPTLDLARPEVVEPMTDSAMFWLENYDLDGFRHDATKHIPELFWRTLTRKVKKEVVQGQGRLVYQIGETYGSPELISSYVGSGMLDAQFDFNLYDAMVDAFAKDETSFDNLVRVLNEGLHIYGDHHTMGNITGNQDRTRFISYADGSVRFDEDPKLAGWTREITIQGEEGYAKLRLLTSFLMSVPGIPCVFYGDEIGIPGANDPDNRRMMRFDGWNEQEQATWNNVQKWIQFRRSHMAMMYGNTRVLEQSEKFLVIEREYLGERILIGFNKDTIAHETTVDGRSLEVPPMDAAWLVLSEQN